MANTPVAPAEAHLATVDPVFAELILRFHPLEPRPQSSDYFTALVRFITGQQISVKAAAAIFGRFEATTNCNPQKVIALDEVAVRAIGLSGQKWRYIRDLAEHFVMDSAVYDHLDTLSDDEVITELTKVKGIGVWTAQMF